MSEEVHAGVKDPDNLYPGPLGTVEDEVRGDPKPAESGMLVANILTAAGPSQDCFETLLELPGVAFGLFSSPLPFRIIRDGIEVTQRLRPEPELQHT